MKLLDKSKMSKKDRDRLIAYKVHTQEFKDKITAFDNSVANVHMSFLSEDSPFSVDNLAKFEAQAEDFKNLKHEHGEICAETALIIKMLKTLQ